MATVKFTSAQEFIDELGKEFGEVPTSPYTILRLTNLFSPIPRLAPIKTLTFVATIKVGNDIIRLDRYCGDIWNMERTDKDAYERAGATRNQVEEAAKKLGIEVRAGIWEE